MGNNASSEEWCKLDSQCDKLKLGLSHVGSDIDIVSNDINATNMTNATCAFPFCVLALHYGIASSNVRIYDIVLVVFSALFLLYLIIQLVPTIKKLKGSVSLFKMLYTMVFLIPVISCIHEALAMTLGYSHPSSKVFHVLLRGEILLTELSVVVFGLFFKYYNNKRLKLLVTLFIIILISVIFTVAEGVLEFLRKIALPCNDFKFFTHGGMIFLFTTSAVFALAYLATFVIYMAGLHQRWNMPSKKSFYRYALFLSLVNVVQAIGSMLWYTGAGRPMSGQAGICLTMITNIIYVATFAPVVYWIFLSNYFRMNKALKKEVEKQINVSTDESSSPRKHQTSMKVTNPVQVRRKRYFEEQTALIAASLDSEASSYGSLNDEEMFTRIRTEPNK